MRLIITVDLDAKHASTGDLVRAEWRKAVADALTNAWSHDATCDELLAAARPALGV